MKMEETNGKVYCKQCRFYNPSHFQINSNWVTAKCHKEKVQVNINDPIHEPHQEWATPYIKNKNNDCPDFESETDVKWGGIW